MIIFLMIIQNLNYYMKKIEKLKIKVYDNNYINYRLF